MKSAALPRCAERVLLTERRRTAAPPPTFRYRSVQKMLAAVTRRPRTGSERYTAEPLCRQLCSRSHSGMAPGVARGSRALPGPRTAHGRRWQPPAAATDGTGPERCAAGWELWAEPRDRPATGRTCVETVGSAELGVVGPIPACYSPRR